MAVFDLLDVEQLEVLRGPQGTLFGKNTTAGVLNITTRKPTFHREGSIQQSIGEDGYLQTKAASRGRSATRWPGASAPIAPKTTAM